jgi:hypothetical protein
MPITCYGHPWGGEQESAKTTGLRLPPPSDGLRDPSPIAGWGTRSLEGAAGAGPVDISLNGGVGDRTLSSVGRTEPSGALKLTDSIETSTDNLSLHKRTSR